MVIESNRNRNLLISIVILFIVVIITMLFFYPSPNHLGKGFDLAIVFIYSRNVLLGAGFLAILLRLFRVFSNYSLWYIMPGVFNLSIGIIGILLYILGEAELSWLNKCLVNLLLGFVMLTDTLFLNYFLGERK